METKVCSKCKEEKSVNEFYKNRRVKDGLNSRCKVCYRESGKEYRLNNPEKEKERCKRYRLNNRGKCKEKVRQWQLNNAEKYKEKQKKYYLNNAEKHKKEVKKWKLKNPEKSNIFQIKNRLKNQIGAIPPPELVDLKYIYLKTKEVCKTLKN